VNEQLARSRGELALREARFVWGARTYVMGIVNASPDSFSGDGVRGAAGAATRALEHLEAGADLVDIGAESTRPGHVPLDAATEAERLLPAVRLIRARAPQAVLSIDSFKAEVFRTAHAAGGDILNSVWGLDAALLSAALECDAPVIVMHNKRVAIYEHSVVDEVLAYLEAQAARAVSAGIPPERVILDPGIGFGKTPEHNLALLGALDRIAALGFPTLLGTSRKSTIGKLTGRDVAQRAFGTAATVALAAAAGIDIVRVPDVAEMRDVVHVTDAIARGWRPTGWRDE